MTYPKHRLLINTNGKTGNSLPFHPLIDRENFNLLSLWNKPREKYEKLPSLF